MNKINTGRLIFLIKIHFFDVLVSVFQKQYDYLILDQDNEYYRHWNELKVWSKTDAEQNIETLKTYNKNKKATPKCNVPSKPPVNVYTHGHCQRQKRATSTLRIIDTYQQDFHCTPSVRKDKSFQKNGACLEI